MADLERKMIFLCMADRRIEPSMTQVIKTFKVDAAWQFPSNWHFYPENAIGRNEIRQFVEKTINFLHSHGYNQVVLTDSDFVFYEYRIAVKQGIIQPETLDIIMLENGSLNRYPIESDGSFYKFPGLMDKYEEQLTKLL